MPKTLDSIHYVSGTLRATVDVTQKHNIREYAVNLFDCGESDGRIIFTDLEAAKNRACEHLAKYEEDGYYG